MNIGFLKGYMWFRILGLGFKLEPSPVFVSTLGSMLGPLSTETPTLRGWVSG